MPAHPPPERDGSWSGLRRRVALGFAVAGITATLIAAIEVSSYAVLQVRRTVARYPPHTHEMYQQFPWADAYWREWESSRSTVYHPYVVWRRPSFRGRTINIDDSGIRLTTGSRCDKDAYRVFMFGGSTLWGEGVPDWATIPSFLAKRFADNARAVCIQNFGEGGWATTQEVIQLLLELRAGDRPYLVIFYDGLNDVFNAFQLGAFDAHQNYAQIKRLLESGGGRTGSFGWILRTNSFLFTERLLDFFGLRRTRSYLDQAAAGSGAIDELSDWVVRSYFLNLEIVDGLSNQFGFKYLFLLQPGLLVDQKPVTPDEQLLRDETVASMPGLRELYRLTYSKAAASKVPQFVNIADAFSAHGERLYIDMSHLFPDGNRVIADRIYDVLQSHGYPAQ